MAVHLMDNDDDRSDRFVVCYQMDSACADLFAIFYCKSNGLAISVFDLSQKTCARDRTGDPLLLAAGSNERSDGVNSKYGGGLGQASLDLIAAADL